MNGRAADGARESQALSTADVLAGLSPADASRAAPPGPGAATALTFAQCQSLLKRRLARPLLNLFHQLTGLRLHPWWHRPGPELPPSALRKLCSQTRQRQPGGRPQVCEQCLQKRWPQGWSDFPLERRFDCVCGLTSFYACLKVQDQPVVTLVVQQPTPASRAAKQAFARAISLTRLIVHDLQGTLEAERVAGKLGSRHNESTTPASGRDAPTPWEPGTAPSGRRRKETLIPKPELKGRRPGPHQNLLGLFPGAAPGEASGGRGSGITAPHPLPLGGERAQQLVQRMLNYIHEHYCRPMQLSDLAAAMKMSSSYVSSLFSTMTGVTFHQYLEKLRLAKAAEFLRDPLKRVGEVAYAVGYTNPDHFRKVFRTRVGLSPGTWRGGGQEPERQLSLPLDFPADRRDTSPLSGRTPAGPGGGAGT